MKKVMVLVLSCLLIVSCSEDKETDKSDNRKTYKTGGIAKLLPENTALMFKISSVKRFYQALSITDDSFFGEPNTWADNVKTMVGFNPYSLKDLQGQGLDIT
ncbi:MAG: hypothetical protein IEMM0008_0539 [bacterium]|nr:MAG: hypothetical protein IEMM0008_0539 [bacterium]